MTMVISVITRDAVFQASDRRLVYLEPDGSTRLKDDNRNKAVMYGNQMVFAYTGLADIGPRREPTDQWIGAVLNEHAPTTENHAVLLEALRIRMMERLRHPLYAKLDSSMTGHEIVACAWARFEDSDEGILDPYISWVSNLRSSDGLAMRQPPGSCARGLSRLPRDGDIQSLVSGQQLSPEHHLAFRADLRDTQGDMSRIVDVLAFHIRLAAETNTSIGKALLVSVLPRAALREGATSMVVTMGGPIAKEASFFSVPADLNDARRYGPIVIWPGGGGGMGGLTVRPLDKSR